MKSIKLTIRTLISVALLAVVISGCKTSSDDESEAEQASNGSSSTIEQSGDKVPFAFVSRSVEAHSTMLENIYTDMASDIYQSPVELLSPYRSFSGAKLIVRTGLESNSEESEILNSYFGSSDYDVKDLSVSPDGTQLIFAAHGPETSATDFTWNIYIYNFTNKSLRRVIANDAIANAGEDTNPVFTHDGNIVFSSDRDAGDPANPRRYEDLIGDTCEKIDPVANPSLLHRMESNGNNIIQLTYGSTNNDISPVRLNDGRIAFLRWETTTNLASQCDDSASKSILKNYTQSKTSGIEQATLWGSSTYCELTKQTEQGSVMVTHHYKLLTIDANSKAMQQLYQTSTASASDEAFLSLDHLLQGEDGNLYSIVSHAFNPVLGGGIIKHRPVQGVSGDSIFSEFSPESMMTPEVDLYPGQLSDSGWFASFAPYRDSSSRFLVSKAQCVMVDNSGVSYFCNDPVANGEMDIAYGIWMYDPSNESSLPVVKVRNDRVFSEIAISLPQQSADLTLNPFNANFIDNADGTKIVCEFDNKPPVANAGNDLNGIIETQYTFNASQSIDPDGDELSYQWKIVDKPDSSSAQLVNANSMSPNFTPDAIGQYQFELIVSDGKLDSEPDYLVLTAIDNNRAPVANAGNDQNVTIGSLVNMDGTASSDPDGDSLSYQWTFLKKPANSNVQLNNSTSGNPAFTPDMVGNYQVQLIVNDGKLDSAADTVNINVDTPPNQAPTANAGRDQSGEPGTVFTLNGAASSDPDGDALTYRWSIQSKPGSSNAVLVNANSVSPGLTPDVEGDYVIQLIVNDGQVDSNLDTTVISASKTNHAPTANAGADQSGVKGDTFVLDGSASSDSDGDQLTFTWMLMTKPATSNSSLINANSVSATLVADVEGDYQVQLTVSDGEFSSTDIALVKAEKLNQKPTADAGVDISGKVNDVISLDGSRSSDPDGDALTYSWILTDFPEGTVAVINNADTVNPTLVPTVAGNYVAQLTVNDGSLDSEPDSVTITVEQVENSIPVADAGADQTIKLADSAILDGSGSHDPDGDSLTYQWSIIDSPEGSVAALTDPTSDAPLFTPDRVGSYVIQLIVNDGQNSSAPDNMTLNVEVDNHAPVADAGADQLHSGVDDTLKLDGSGSYDPDGDNLSYTWSVSSPADASLNFSDVNAVAPEVKITQDVIYVIKLVVSDGVSESEDFVELSPSNIKPVAVIEASPVAEIAQTITLDGSKSFDVNGDPLTYHWAIVEKPNDSQTNLSSATEVQPEVTFDIAGSYTFELIVNDGLMDSDVSIKSITVSDESINHAPIAVAGNDVSVGANTKVELDGNASYDPDGDAITYHWDLIHKPDGSEATLSSSSSATPSIFIDKLGDYVVQLVVNDGELDSVADTLLITSKNLPPVAIAGLPFEVTLGNKIIVDGSASYDPDGDYIHYQWSMLSAPEGNQEVLMNTGAVRAWLRPQIAGTYVFQLIVNDGVLYSEPDTVVVTVVAEDDCDDNDDVDIVLSKDKLWPPNHKMHAIDYTLITGVCSGGCNVASGTIEVWSDEAEQSDTGDSSGRFAPDYIEGDGLLYLRAERQGNEDGRVYLVIARVSNNGVPVGFACNAVVVPKSISQQHIADVRAQAAEAVEYCRSFSAAPSDFVKHGESVPIGPKGF
ncbi:PKD domain-containing protein [Aliikangiella sp. G2MR2-5]|uniref:PKD domain-containing protein n=1 Tax=Aliikangiella sp. G2MR2-5 TaxID=2788943 RepID=UPI0018AB7DFB|nr:PKD domain-containing protein [Aliikangiella sp. G2MR2-5]